jgi:6-phosphofructokinase 1
MSTPSAVDMKVLLGFALVASIVVPLASYVHCKTMNKLKEEARQLREQIIQEQAAVIQYHLPECPKDRPPIPETASSESLLMEGESVVTMRPLNLAEIYGEQREESPLYKRYASESFGNATFGEGPEYVTEAILRDPHECGKQFRRYLAAIPQRQLYWKPQAVKAAIITCGGISPGINNCVRELVHTLQLYGAREVWGVRKGYKGLCDERCWTRLRLEDIESVHQNGGSFLVSGRGNDTVEDMGKALMKRGINQLYVIGGDGTFRGAGAIESYLESCGYPCSVTGVASTIDNDIPFIDSCFGFSTVVQEAVVAIEAAYVEATGAPRGLGLVKLMGRHSGFVTVFASTAAGVVDVALIPEMDEVDLKRLCLLAKAKIEHKGSCLVVVTEGCKLDPSQGEQDVGVFLKTKFDEFSKTNSLGWTIKYIDPSLMIRAVPANPYDSVFCSVLAQNAVHAAMAGYTGVASARCSDRFVLLPARLIGNSPRKQINLKGRVFARLVLNTQQPSLNKPGQIPRMSSFFLGS